MSGTCCVSDLCLRLLDGLLQLVIVALVDRLRDPLVRPDERLLHLVGPLVVDHRDDGRRARGQVLLDIDAELDNLRKLPEFQKLQVTIERRNVEAMLASAKPHPFTFSLPDVDGKSVTLDDVKGEITIVDFWGTWCPPCRKEIPHLIDLANRYKALITGSTSKDGFADAEFVIEAVFEEMSVKKQVFADVEKAVSPECVLATNTSSLSITEMAADLEHP